MNGSYHTLQTGIKEWNKKNKILSHNTFSNWGVTKHSVPQGSILSALLFFLYINDYSKTIKGKSKPVLFTNDTSMIFTDSNF